MWFELFMDDLKKAFYLAYENKGIFIPVFLKLAMQLVLGFVLLIGTVICIISGIFSGISEAEPMDLFLSMAIPGVVILLLLYGIYLVLWACIEVGSIRLYQGAIQQQPLTKALFFDGIRHYMTRVASGKLLLHFIILALSPILILVYVLSVLFIGTLSAGWGILFINVSIACLLATWTIAIVNDNKTVMDGFRTSLSMAKRHFKTLFTLLFSSAMVMQYAIHLLGPVGLIFGGWFIGGIVTTYFKLAIYLTYLRYSNTLME